MPLIELEKLSKNFGGLRAVDSLDIVLDKGEILGLIGPNGSGKTTLFNLITGFLKPSEGKVIFDGDDITGLGPHAIAKRGIGRIFQQTALFNESSVLENVIMALHLEVKAGFWMGVFDTSRARSENKDLERKAREILEFVGLGDLEDELALNLPYGRQRCLSLAIGLSTNPTLFLLDEPFTGMNAEEMEVMVDITKKIMGKGITLIVIEHHMESIMALCERIVVLNYGKKIAEGSPQEIIQNKEVIEAYLGAEEDVF